MKALLERLEFLRENFWLHFSSVMLVAAIGYSQSKILFIIALIFIIIISLNKIYDFFKGWRF